MNDLVLRLDKPEGVTSFDIVRDVKKKYASLETGRKKVPVGHTGTLDPFATGLLLVLVGDRAVKCSELLLGSDKTYEATLLFGKKTNTGDKEGACIEEAPVPRTTLQALQKHFDCFRERPYFQKPPMTSAKRVDGQRLYTLARKGLSIPRESVLCALHQLEALEWESPKLRFRVRAQKGTFIRTLAEDFARSIGTTAHLIQLRRTHIGPHTLPMLPEATSLDAFFKSFDALELSQEEWTALSKGHPDIRHQLIEKDCRDFRPLYFEGKLKGFLQHRNQVTKIQPLFV